MDDLVKLGMSVRRIIQDDKSPGGLMIEYVPLQRFVDIVDQEAKGVIHQLAAEITRLRAALETARRDALEEAGQIASQWRKVDELLLRAGEMTAQEIRTAKAVAGGIEGAIRALIQPNTSPS